MQAGTRSSKQAGRGGDVRGGNTAALHRGAAAAENAQSNVPQQTPAMAGKHKSSSRLQPSPLAFDALLLSSFHSTVAAAADCDGSWLRFVSGVGAASPHPSGGRLLTMLAETMLAVTTICTQLRARWPVPIHQTMCCCPCRCCSDMHTPNGGEEEGVEVTSLTARLPSPGRHRAISSTAAAGTGGPGSPTSLLLLPHLRSAGSEGTSWLVSSSPLSSPHSRWVLGSCLCAAGPSLRRHRSVLHRHAAAVPVLPCNSALFCRPCTACLERPAPLLLADAPPLGAALAALACLPA
jgi:hypothetical protein